MASHDFNKSISVNLATLKGRMGSCTTGISLLTSILFIVFIENIKFKNQTVEATHRRK